MVRYSYHAWIATVAIDVDGRQAAFSQGRVPCLPGPVRRRVLLRGLDVILHGLATFGEEPVVTDVVGLQASLTKGLLGMEPVGQDHVAVFGGEAGALGGHASGYGKVVDATVWADFEGPLSV